MEENEKFKHLCQRILKLKNTNHAVTVTHCAIENYFQH